MKTVMRSVGVALVFAIAVQCARASSPLRISGGSMALPGQFRYQAVVQSLDSVSGQVLRLCSGALIDPHWVLTSASCISDGTTFTVTLGAFDLTEASEETRQTFTSSYRVIHEGYKSGNNENDIGLLKLGLAAVEDEFVAPILLPSKQQVSKSFSFWQGSVAGWGGIKQGDQSGGNWVLRWFDSRVVPNFWCKFRNGANLVHDTNICVSTFFWKKGICVGDAGSPLAALEKDDTPVLLGIASDNGASCGNFKPAVFTRVASYLDWISAATSIALRG